MQRLNILCKLAQSYYTNKTLFLTVPSMRFRTIATCGKWQNSPIACALGAPHGNDWVALYYLRRRKKSSHQRQRKR